jgi:hypothetical protein
MVTGSEALVWRTTHALTAHYALVLCWCCADPLEAMQEVMDKTQWGPACVYRRVDNMIHGKHQVKAV